MRVLFVATDDNGHYKSHIMPMHYMAKLLDVPEDRFTYTEVQREYSEYMTPDLIVFPTDRAEEIIDVDFGMVAVSMPKQFYDIFFSDQYDDQRWFMDRLFHAHGESHRVVIDTNKDGTIKYMLVSTQSGPVSTLEIDDIDEIVELIGCLDNANLVTSSGLDGHVFVGVDALVILERHNLKAIFDSVYDSEDNDTWVRPERVFDVFN